MYASPILVHRGSVRTVTFGGSLNQTAEDQALKPHAANTASGSETSPEDATSTPNTVNETQ
jgi:hypothetical protein